MSNFLSFPTIDLNDNDPDYAIEVKNVNFWYNKETPVLKNFCMKVEKGGIFALLGSNGCGKTTLLKLILGQAKPKTGRIRVYGLEPGHRCSDIPGRGVGYMPQEIALFDKFTIKECLHYFGKIYDMKPTLIDHRIALLIELLNLPQMDKTICELSGGQKRLVSMAVTIIHRPKLLILDEPTVGVDSILRCRIWSYLESIAKNYGTTIMITTHYIEEAKSAKMVGFLSTGILLKQANPAQLLREHNCNTLEEVFLILCQDHYRKLKEKKLYQKHWLTEDDSEPEPPLDTSSMGKTKLIALNHIDALIMKNLVRLKRSSFALGLYFILPLLTISIFRHSVGTTPKNVPIAIYAGNDQNRKLADIMANSFDPHLVKFKFYNKEEAAIKSVELGQNMYALSLPENFSRAVYERLPNPFAVNDQVLRDSLIRVYCDQSDAITSIFVRYTYFIEALLNFVETLGKEIDLEPILFSLPIDRSNPIFPGDFRKSENYPSTGIFLALLFLMSIALSSMVIIYETTNKSLDRVYVSGVKRIEVLIVHMIEMCVLIAIQVTTSLALFYYLFDIQVDNRVIHVFALVYLHGIEGAGIGLLIALLFKSAIHVFIIVVGIMIPLLTISGVIWPSEAIPPLARLIIDWTPITQPLESLRSLLFRGLTISYSRVWIGFVISMVYNVSIFTLNILFTTYWKNFDINRLIPMLKVPN